jgi:hypothetical protein
MAAEVPYHIGVLVTEIELARRQLGAALGLTFGDVESRRLDFGADGVEDVVLCYSREGPPYFELIEATGAGLFGTQHPRGVHHLGMWINDGPAHCALLASQSIHSDRRLHGVDGPHGHSENYVWFNAPEDLCGLRFEFVDDRARAMLETRFRGDPNATT